MVDEDESVVAICDTCHWTVASEENFADPQEDDCECGGTFFWFEPRGPAGP